MIGPRDRAASRTREFHYKNLGNMATIGRNAAIADLGWLRVVRVSRVAALAVHPHRLADWLPQPDHSCSCSGRART